jgi:predicted nucleic-acid-binding protein
VLVRALVQDDPEQAKGAADLLESAELIAIPVQVLCELVWVLRRVYGFAASDCATSIEALMGSSGVAMDRQAVRAGLKLLSAGGDFADGVIAYGGRALGGEQGKKACRSRAWDPRDRVCWGCALWLRHAPSCAPSWARRCSSLTRNCSLLERAGLSRYRNK